MARLWRPLARLPPAMHFASGRTREARGSCWSGTVAVEGVRMAAQKKFSEFCGNACGVAEKDDRDYDDIVIKFVQKVGDRTISTSDRSFAKACGLEVMKRDKEAVAKSASK
jgi:hypothetical protein